MEIDKIISLFGPIITAISSTGPYGVLMLVLLGGLGVFGYNFWVSKINKKADETDQKLAGEDAGKTATDLKNQTDIVRQKLEQVTQDYKPEEEIPP